MIFRGRYQVLGLIAILAVFISADMVMAQPGRSRGGGIFGQQTKLSLLGQSSVQKDLELVEDQIEIIRDIQSRQRDAMRELFMGMQEKMRGMSGEERSEAFQEIREEMTKSNEEMEAEAMEELLPHQASRLKQIHAQAQIRRNGGPANGNIPDSLAEELGLTEKQIEELRSKAESVGAKLKEKVAKLQAQAQEEIFSSVLSDEQYDKYKELMGDAFQFEERGGFGSRFGDRGGRGGGDRGDRGDRGGRGGEGRGGDRGSDF